MSIALVTTRLARRRPQHQSTLESYISVWSAEATSRLQLRTDHFQGQGQGVRGPAPEPVAKEGGALGERAVTLFAIPTAYSMFSIWAVTPTFLSLAQPSGENTVADTPLKTWRRSIVTSALRDRWQS